MHTFIYNPYENLTFFAFLLQFFQRMFELLTGQIAFNSLVSDEIQVLVLMGISISCALIGVFLVLKCMTMLANSLSHTILIGIVLAYLFSRHLAHETSQTERIAPLFTMLIASLLTGFLTTFLTEFLIKFGQIQKDASTGLVFTSLFACGIILVTVLTRNSHIGTEAVMGNADALNKQDLIGVSIIVVLNLLLCWIFFKEYLITTFDSGLALALGISPLVYNYLLMSQVSITTISAFRAVGVLLVLSFLTGPALTAKLLTYHLKKLIALAILIGMLCSLFGVALSRHILTAYGVALSTAGIVSSTIFICYCIVAFGIEIRRYVWHYLGKNDVALIKETNY